jgi:hypothetical protein
VNGYVYFIQSSDGLLKIGHSTNPIRRYEYLSSRSSSKLTHLGCVPGGFEEERMFHNLIGGKPVQGREWFNASAESLAAVKTLPLIPLEKLTPVQAPKQAMVRISGTVHRMVKKFALENGMTLEGAIKLLLLTALDMHYSNEKEKAA